MAESVILMKMLKLLREIDVHLHDGLDVVRQKSCKAGDFR